MKKALKSSPRGAAFTFAGQRWVVLEHNATGPPGSDRQRQGGRGISI